MLDYRIVDVETSEVVASGEARGESKRSSAGGGVAFLAGGAFGGGGVNMASSNFGETIIGEATMDAVDKLALDVHGVNLNGGADSRDLDLDALVADVSDNTITINAGAAAGLQVGQTFTVYHKGKVIKDPATGEVLDVQTTPLGSSLLRWCATRFPWALTRGRRNRWWETWCGNEVHTVHLPDGRHSHCPGNRRAAGSASSLRLFGQPRDRQFPVRRFH